jgi:hypothetical protein
MNCTFPRDLYKKCLRTVPGIRSVHLGRPRWTARRISSRLPFLPSCCACQSRQSIDYKVAISVPNLP